jgi:hypothetical protein
MTANAWVRGWDVQSRSEPGKKHRVSQAADGHFGCACGKWAFAKAPKPDCHHIVEVKRMLVIFPSFEARAIETLSYTITELSQADLLAGPIRRKVRKEGSE